MIDENAFGLVLGYLALEDEEYGLERELFVARALEFPRTVLDLLETRPCGSEVLVLDLGHLVYAEIADGNQTDSPLRWVRTAREQLEGLGFQTLAAVTYGGRWVAEPAETPLPELTRSGPIEVCSFCRPSEPLRRALAADAAARRDPEASQGWGPGLYVDTEAVEPLGLKLRNLPTPLYAGEASFYRLGT